MNAEKYKRMKHQNMAGKCGFLFFWILALVCIIFGCIFGSSDLIADGIAIVILSVPIFCWIIIQRWKMLFPQMDLENNQIQLAHTEGLEKYFRMNVEEIQKNKNQVATLYKFGKTIQDAPYQERPKDWAIWGGIAEGLGGPAAGAATAIKTMQENENIEARNAARRQKNQEDGAFWIRQSLRYKSNCPPEYNLSQLQEIYEVDLSWSPTTLFSFISIISTSIDYDGTTDAVTVSVDWIQKNHSICIDGALRAKLYTGGCCAGCAYLVFPKNGTSNFSGRLSGICTNPKPSYNYSIKVEPADLWELAPKKGFIAKETDHLTPEQHRDIVSEYEKNFNAEIEDKRKKKLKFLSLNFTL